MVLAHSGIDVATVTILPTSSTKVVARVETSAGEDFAVKMSTDLDSLAVERENNMSLAEAGIPVPAVKDLIETTLGEANVGALMMGWLPGDAVSAASPPAVQREVGSHLRRIHELGGGPPYHGGNSVYVHWIRGWVKVALAWWSAYATRSGLADAWAWFMDLAPVIASRGRDRILFDGRPEHFITDDDHVVGIIDLADLTAGDSAMDLGVIAANDPGLLSGVIAGYQPTATERAVFAELVPFYGFLRAIAAAEWNLVHGDARVAPHMLVRAAEFLPTHTRDG